MKIYIASSWKNQHGVEMLTALLRERGHQVISWIENNYGETHNHVTKKFPFEEWVNSPEANQSFEFDTSGATNSDLVIYYGPAGKDACAELGAAWASGVPIIGLWAKGEDIGLMRKMVSKWYDRYTDLLIGVDDIVRSKESKGYIDSLRVAAAEFNSKDKEAAREFLEAHGINTHILVTDGLNKIKEVQP